MNQKSFRETIDEELRVIELNNAMKGNIRMNISNRKRKKSYKFALTSLALFLLCGTTVFAGYYIESKINVNEETLPELDALQTVEISELKGAKDQYGMSKIDFTDYDTLQQDWGIPLLNSGLSDNNPYMLGHIFSDNKDFCIITVDNYIIGDTSNYRYIAEENRYSYDSGSQYRTSISLTADIVLSEDQLENGWDTDYLGMYEFVENYTSEQGFQVNLIQSNNGDEELPSDAVTEKCAIFVSGGIRYTLKGHTSLNTMKEIVNSMN